MGAGSGSSGTTVTVVTSDWPKACSVGHIHRLSGGAGQVIGYGKYKQGARAGGNDKNKFYSPCSFVQGQLWCRVTEVKQEGTKTEQFPDTSVSPFLRHMSILKVPGAYFCCAWHMTM